MAEAGTITPIFTASLASILSTHLLTAGNSSRLSSRIQATLTTQKLAISAMVYLLPTRYSWEESLDSRTEYKRLISLVQ